MKVALSASILSLAVLAGAMHASKVFERPEFVSESLSSVRSSSAKRTSVAKNATKTPTVLDFAKQWTGKPVYQSGPNCFGTTLAAFNSIPKPRFANDAELREFLKTCQPVTTPKVGDVGVLYDLSSKTVESEVHSFIVIDAARSFYKNGLEAGGGFLTAPNSKMFKDFNTGVSQAACDRVAEQSFEETGLPCPTVARYFRCSHQSVALAGREFSKSEAVSWDLLQTLDTRISEAQLMQGGPKAGDVQGILTAASMYTLSLGQLEIKDGSVKSPFAALASARTESLISFLSYNVDDKKWSMDSIKAIKADLIKAKNALTSYRTKARL